MNVALRAGALLGVLSFVTATFPNYDNPVTASPPLRRAGKLRHRAPLITNAELTSYGQLWQQQYVPPPISASKYDQVVLEWDGAVKGVQFDRYGALWLGEVELLRTTTPEPSPRGITWHVEKDVTEYAALFGGGDGDDNGASNGETLPKNATLSIPNVVDTTYTGVLRVNASLAFYSYSLSTGNADTATPIALNTSEAGGTSMAGSGGVPMVRSLVCPVTGGAPWNALSVVGNSSQEVALMLPKGVRNARRVFVDVFASGHQCEEFWYTNLPDTLAPAYGACGGGAFRLLELRIDGVLAGARFPFPVVYTGGINPLLWRPLTGIESFDVVPYRFDLSAFAGLLNDGLSHRLSLKVVGNNDKGVWYLDPVLLVYTDGPPSQVPLSGRVSTSILHSLDVRVQPHNVSRYTPVSAAAGENNSGVFISTATSAPFAFRVSGTAGPYSSSVSYSLLSDNNNTVTVDGNMQTTVGAMVQEIVATATAGAHRSNSLANMSNFHRTSHSTFRYSVVQNSKQDNSSFDLRAQVAPISRTQREQIGDFAVEWSNEIAADARYNRSTGPERTINVQAGTSHESFVVKSRKSGTGSPLMCYNVSLDAVNGSILPSGDGGIESVFRCALPHGIKFCGEVLCGLGVDGLAPGPQQSGSFAQASEELSWWHTWKERERRNVELQPASYKALPAAVLLLRRPVLTKRRATVAHETDF